MGWKGSSMQLGRKEGAGRLDRERIPDLSERDFRVGYVKAESRPGLKGRGLG